MSGLLERAAVAWWEWMAPMVWQTALLALLVACLDRFIRRRAWPELRSILWSIVIVRLLVPPSWSSDSSLMSVIRGLVPAAPQSVPMASSLVEGREPRGVVFGVVLFVLWITGLIVCAVVDLRRQRRLARELMSEAQPLRIPPELLAMLGVVARRLGLEQIPPIVISSRFDGPAVFGALRPCVVLPAHFVERASPRSDVESGGGGGRGRETRHIEHILMHELAHVRRRDLLVAAAIRAVAILYWFHPAVWIAQRELAALRELGCDATVSSHLRERTAEYREALLECARSLTASHAPARAPTRPSSHWSRAGFWHGSSHLLLRLAALERPLWKYARCRRIGSVIAFALLAFFVLPMAVTQDPVVASSAGTIAKFAVGRSSTSRSADPLLEEALATLQRAAGGERESCLRLHYSAMLIASRESDAIEPPGE